jgi:hypothetical protein
MSPHLVAGQRLPTAKLSSFGLCSSQVREYTRKRTAIGKSGSRKTWPATQADDEPNPRLRLYSSFLLKKSCTPSQMLRW